MERPDPSEVLFAQSSLLQFNFLGVNCNVVLVQLLVLEAFQLFDHLVPQGFELFVGLSEDRLPGSTLILSLPPCPHNTISVNSRDKICISWFKIILFLLKLVYNVSDLTVLPVFVPAKFENLEDK